MQTFLLCPLRVQNLFIHYTVDNLFWHRCVSGQSHLISSSKDLEHILIIPSCLELFGVNADFGSFLLLEQIEDDVAKNSQIFGSLIFSYAAMVLVQGNIQPPMQLIFDESVLTDYMENALCTARQSGDVVAHELGLLASNDAGTNYHGNGS